MKKLLVLCCAVFLMLDLAHAQTKPGTVTGGRAHEMPSWFKSSFLNFKDDVEEARKAGRHILVFMDLNDCPYCARTLDENFRQGDNMEFIRKHFDVIAINIRGAGEVTWIDGATYTEQSLAHKLKVVGTPTLVFLSPDGKKVLQLNGYRTPPTLRRALEYVNDKAYRNQSLAAYTEKKQATSVYKFREYPPTAMDGGSAGREAVPPGTNAGAVFPRFEKVTDFARYQAPLAVIFEDKNCVDCDSFHEKVLNHPDVVAELKAFRLVRLDAYANTAIVDLAGKRTTPRAWAAALGLTHRPGVVLFNEGKEAARVEGRFYHFHFKEMLRFVSGRHYQRYDRFGAYLQDRQSELINQGVNIDLAE